MALVQGVAPVIAPSIGALVLFVAPWRAALASIGAVLLAAGAGLFAESQPRDMRRSLKPAAILAGYRRALTSPLYAGFSLVNGLVFAGMLAYINTLRYCSSRATACRRRPSPACSPSPPSAP